MSKPGGMVLDGDTALLSKRVFAGWNRKSSGDSTGSCSEEQEAWRFGVALASDFRSALRDELRWQDSGLGEQAFHIARHEIDFEIYLVAFLQGAQGGDARRVWDDQQRDGGILGFVDGE